RAHPFGQGLAILDPWTLVGAHRRLDALHEKLLRQDHVRRAGVAVRAELAPPEQAEALVGGDHPRLFRTEPALLPETFEDGRGDGRFAAIGVDVLLAAGDEGAGGVE